MIDAEGHRMPGKREGHSEFVRIVQVDGPLQNAIRLAVYLEGWRPTFSANSSERNGFQPAGAVGLAKPHVSPSMFQRPQELPLQTVWCVKTGLETWTAELDGQIFLTGNTIPGTFGAYALPGHGNILNPVDNIVAGIRYILSRYGDIFHTPGMLSLARGGAYVGYDSGGILPPGFTMAYNGTGRNEYVSRGGGSSGPVTIQVNVNGPVYGTTIDALARQLVEPIRTALYQQGRQTGIQVQV
jgi:hypothetical protein